VPRSQWRGNAFARPLSQSVVEVGQEGAHNILLARPRENAGALVCHDVAREGVKLGVDFAVVHDGEAADMRAEPASTGPAGSDQIDLARGSKIDQVEARNQGEAHELGACDRADLGDCIQHRGSPLVVPEIYDAHTPTSKDGTERPL
jgi:hypothetical protein